MKRRTTFIIVAILVASVMLAMGLSYWRAQRREQVNRMLRDATRYAGATGPTITAFDERTNRWLAEMKEETIEETLRKLTDAAEYVGIAMLPSSDSPSFNLEWERERTIYSKDIEIILGNRRFRKAYEDLQKINKKKAAELLIKNIEENVAELRRILQSAADFISSGEHKGTIARVIAIVVDDKAYRPMTPPNVPPSPNGRRYAIFSYMLLASLLELREVRPAIEKAAQLAKDQYALFERVDSSEAYDFKQIMLLESLYNPSLLLTATLCDPTWNTGKKKRLEAQLIKNREVVDYRARAIEHDKDAREGWLPVVPYEKMLKIRYYKGITDADFNDFFGK